MELGFVGMMVASVLFALGSSEESLCYILALFAYCCTLSFMMNYCTAITIEYHVQTLWAFVDMHAFFGSSHKSQVFASSAHE